ncbi:CDK-activating kinase assembly factor MAT1 isoform X2 [Plodia interpunctella]|uniref:CDK-activating kinase assembly factor MAT1 isoform X2 n=1 Tax=Plodia interpunctella TaxID=58824 RepID=UPI00236842B6|nr:CDK-activating kinase assembly factor MAT1 isoform X2 [Plodia interpunctella]
MDDQACPRCKTTKYRNPSLKLMVNVCGHTLCESCVDLLFLKGSGSCPECNVPLRRSNFRVQLFEDPMVEKEIDIRKRVLKDYNKKEEDFATLREYNDYLEEIETIIFNLTNNIDVVNTNKKIEQYKKENREIIMKNKAKIGQEELELEEILEIEKQMEDLRRAEIARMEQEAKKQKIREKEALIDELMFAEGDAKDILNTFAQTIANKQEEAVSVVPKGGNGNRKSRRLFINSTLSTGVAGCVCGALPRQLTRPAACHRVRLIVVSPAADRWRRRRIETRSRFVFRFVFFPN